MAGAKKLYALSNISTPDGIVRPGAEVEGLDEDNARALVDEGAATYDAKEAEAAAGSSVAVPPYGSNTGGLEVVEETIG